MIKQFRQPAPHQKLILQAFEESGREKYLDDPLPRGTHESDEDAKRRLSKTLENLNASLPAATIRFRGDGTGKAIYWELRGSKGKARD